MRISKITLGIVMICLIAAGCTRKNDLIEDPAFPTGGKGGKGVLRVTPKHHGKNIDSCTIYLKYDATRMPATPAWDEIIKVSMDNGNPVAVFDSLSLGHYFIYAEGFDPVVDTDTIGATVTGNGPFTLLDSTKTYNLVLDVTEAKDHVHTPLD